MKTIAIWGLLAILFLQISIAQPPKNKSGRNQPLYKLEEFHQRAGLKNVFYKIDTARFVRVAYLGGSITEAAGGWRELTFNWFRLNYPQTIFTQINAGIGGTGSDLGVFRIEDEVLKETPDLLFVEFAVNDAALSREQVLRSMEGIIRKTRKHNPHTDICFVYTITEVQCNLLLEGKLHTAVLAMEELATHYGIPSIHMGISVARLFAEDKLLFTAPPSKNATTIVFTQDKVHPLSESGHPLYAAVVARYLEKMKGSKKATPHALSDPLVTDNWQHAKMIGIEKIDKQGSWTKLSADDPVFKTFLKRLPDVYMGAAQAKLKFRFKGTTLGIYDIIGPGAGALKITIDGKEQQVPRFDKYCTYWRLSNKIIFDQLEDKDHEVEIEVLAAGLDKTKILMDTNLEKYRKSPDDYVNENSYIGKILLVGELL